MEAITGTYWQTLDRRQLETKTNKASENTCTLLSDKLFKDGKVSRLYLVLSSIFILKNSKLKVVRDFASKRVLSDKRKRKQDIYMPRSYTNV